MDVGPRYAEPRYAEPIDISADVVVTDMRPKFIGNYSYVYIGYFKNSLAAIKVLRPLSGATMTSMQRKMEREMKVWAALEHPNIVPLYGYAEGEEIFGSFGALVSPWYQNGNAGEYLERYGTSLTTDERISLWIGVVTGVQFLHTFDPCIVHGDLKPCDFGLSRIYADEPGSGLMTTSEHTGTERYLAFELVVSDTTPIPSTASDVWALGCIGLEMVFLQVPYGNRRSNRYGHITRDISTGVPPALRLEAPDEASFVICDILRSCWEKEPASRISVGQIYHAIIGKNLDAHDHDPSQSLDSIQYRTAYQLAQKLGYTLNFKFKEDASEYCQVFTCTFYIDSSPSRSCTGMAIDGAPKDSEAEAKEDAARETCQILQIWTNIMLNNMLPRRHSGTAA